MTDEEMRELQNLLTGYLAEREFGKGWPAWPGDGAYYGGEMTHVRVSQGWRVYGQLVALSEGVYRG